MTLIVLFTSDNYFHTQLGVVEASGESYLVEPVQGSGSAHIAYEVQQSPLPEVENIGGADEDGGTIFCYILIVCFYFVDVVVALPCPKLDDLENGQVTVGSHHVGSIATYRCDKEFQCLGPRARRCLSTALWSGTTPVCVPKNPAGMIVHKH